MRHVEFLAFFGSLWEAEIRHQWFSFCCGLVGEMWPLCLEHVNCFFSGALTYCTPESRHSRSCCYTTRPAKVYQAKASSFSGQFFQMHVDNLLPAKPTAFTFHLVSTFCPRSDSGHSSTHCDCSGIVFSESGFPSSFTGITLNTYVSFS